MALKLIKIFLINEIKFKMWENCSHFTEQKDANSKLRNVKTFIWLSRLYTNSIYLDCEIEDEQPADIQEPGINFSSFDLRLFTRLGDVYHIQILELPPQQMILNGWTWQQVDCY